MSQADRHPALRADFTERVWLDTRRQPWQASPQAGVERIPLDRIGAEIARATSLVRYAAGSRFPAHVHGGGEEILVLDGLFSDEQGDYPAGTYLRNPPGSRHAPGSPSGCTLFVKLWQFAADDTRQCRLDTRQLAWQAGEVDGLDCLPLHAHGALHVLLERWQPGTRGAAHAHPGGEELLVLEGSLADEAGVYPAGSWLRNPCGSRHQPFSKDGALVYVQRGHLGQASCWDLRKA